MTQQSFAALGLSADVIDALAQRGIESPFQIQSRAIPAALAGQDILVDGRKVTTVDEALASAGDEIAPLKAELALHASKQVVRAENKAQSKSVTIMGDKDIPYRLLRKVMATAARADYSDVSFAVTKRFKT